MASNATITRLLPERSNTMPPASIHHNGGYALDDIREQVIEYSWPEPPGQSNPISPNLRRHRRASKLQRPSRPASNLTLSQSMNNDKINPLRLRPDIDTPKAFSFAGIRQPLSPSAHVSGDIDDLYDSILQDSIIREEPLEIEILMAQNEPNKVSISRRPSRRSTHNPRFGPSRVANDLSIDTAAAMSIPEAEQWPSVSKNQIVTPSQMKPTMTPISPAALSLLASDAPALNAPPSLDGSQSSEQQQLVFDSPNTPSSQPLDDSAEWGGVMNLHPDALALLHCLPSNNLDDDAKEQQDEDALSPISIAQPPMTMGEMRETLVTSIRNRESHQPLSPTSEQAFDSLGKLDIPSPDEFFGTLPSVARHAWNGPNTSAAESFYNIPWRKQANDAPPMPALPSPPAENDSPSVYSAHLNDSMVQLLGPTDITTQAAIKPDVNLERDYLAHIAETSSANLFRTSLWLTQQTDILLGSSDDGLPSPTKSAVSDEDLYRIPTPKAFSTKTNPLPTIPQTPPPRSSPLLTLTPPSSKPSSRNTSVDVGDVISGVITTVPTGFPSGVPSLASCESSFDPSKRTSVHLHAFQDIIHHSSASDAIIQGSSRSHALRTSRTVLSTVHRSQLASDYNTTIKQPKSLETPEQVIGHQLAMRQQLTEILGPATWSISAERYLNNGKLVLAPIQKLLRLAPATEDSKYKVRVLDLGGAPVADWGWHCASMFPNVQVYTVVNGPPQTAFDPKSAQGPKNHRQAYVDDLYDLPFPENHFDLISARSLPMFLKARKPLGARENLDEYDLCLQECMRCLKPGGFLEFSIFDAELANPGALGAAKSAEFSVNLQSRGYDPSPSREWLSRLNRSGFWGTKRAWTFLPVGARATSEEFNAYSTSQSVAHVTGLYGSWNWERWMLKLHLEAGKPLKDASLDYIDAVLEEGKTVGAGWKCLKGYTRKPLAQKVYTFL
jgi:SAM-dependent methyltransferase